MGRSDLTPDQLADLTRDHTGAQQDLDDLVGEHRGHVAQCGDVLATAHLMVRLADQPHGVAAGYAAHAVTRLVEVEAENAKATSNFEEFAEGAAETRQQLAAELATVTAQRDDALQMLGDLNPAIELTDKTTAAITKETH